MNQFWTIFTTTLGLIISTAGLVFTCITLNTARQIKNRIKDKKDILQYKKVIEEQKKRIEDNDPYRPTDHREEIKRILVLSLKYVRRNKRKEMENRCNRIQMVSEQELLLLMGSFIIELDDEGV